MIKPIPDLDVCQHRESGEFALLHSAAYMKNDVYLGNATHGSIQRLTAEEFRRDGLDVVRQSLAAFENRRFEGTSEFESLGAKGKKRFFKDHRCLGISLQSNGDLWLDPVKHEERGIPGTSDFANRQIVSTSAGGDEFYAAVLRALPFAD